uniref:Uncharacterized protein n=1 Tax=Theropithecus gelada TaxID=9565 RepID=A0A8D2E5F7_THEGE
MTRVAPMPLPTHQTVRRKKRRRKRRLPSLESRAGIACWGLEPRDCPCTVLPRMGAQGLGRPPGQETLGPQQRRVVAVGPLRSGCGRMEMPCLERGPWAPFQALLPSLTKASLRRSVCPPSARRAAFCGSPWSNALGLPGAPLPVRAAGAAPLPAHRPGRASRSS